MTASLAELQKQIDDLRNQIATLPDYSALIAETRKAYALDSAVVHMSGVESIGGVKTFSGTVTAPKFQTASASVSANSGVATTIYTIPNASVSMYLVTANIGTVGDAPNYSSFAVIASDSASARIAMSSNGALLTISLSGLAVRVAQSSGATQTVNVTVTKIG